MPEPHNNSSPRFLIRHVGNMGDLVFFIPPVLATLKRRHPGCHITLVTAWGFKDKRGRWGPRNQGGFSLHLVMPDPHIDELVHWHDTRLSLDKRICFEAGRRFPTWSAAYYEQQKQSGAYDAVYELDFGIKPDDNPIRRLYDAINLPDEDFSNYRLYFTESDQAVAQTVMANRPHPRIVLLEGLDNATTRGWDVTKNRDLDDAIQQTYGISPIWFGSKYVPEYEGRPLTLRENIATLLFCDVAIGVLTAPLHFAAASGLPTITLYCDMPLHRGAPAYFLNKYIDAPARRHRTLLGPDCEPEKLLKSPDAPACLTPAEQTSQRYRDWVVPGRQNTKSCLAVITVDEIMAVLTEAVPQAGRGKPA